MIVVQGETEMTEKASLSRFIVRQGAVTNTWMVWDRQTRRPARTGGALATNLSEEQARELREKLTRDQGAGAA